MMVIIVGSGGQDGRLLSGQLAAEGHTIVGIRRDRVESPKALGTIAPVDIRHADEVSALVALVQPEEVYYLTAHHHSSEQPPEPPGEVLRRSIETNLIGFVNVLDAVSRQSPAARVFYAGSSRVFGQNPTTPIQDETTPFRPECAYGISKAAAIETSRLYRRSHGLFVSTGILYNHESIYRGTQFVSRKIVRAAVAAARGEVAELVLGDISARVDWGYAPDYVRAMRLILALKVADDFVIATGESHSVGDFAQVAFDTVGLDWNKFVRERRDVLRRAPLPLVGNALKLRTASGWCPSLDFRGMVQTLVRREQEEANFAR
jgi:GDPmannose 4,6-dehydratase